MFDKLNILFWEILLIFKCYDKINSKFCYWIYSLDLKPITLYFCHYKIQAWVKIINKLHQLHTQFVTDITKNFNYSIYI